MAVSDENQIDVGPRLLRQAQQIPRIGGQDLVTVLRQTNQGGIQHIRLPTKTQQNAGQLTQLLVQRFDLHTGEKTG